MTNKEFHTKAKAIADRLGLREMECPYCGAKIECRYDVEAKCPGCDRGLTFFSPISASKKKTKSKSK